MEYLKKKAVELCGISAPSGREKNITEIISSELRNMGYTVEILPLGSVIAYRGERTGKTMLSARVDTIGFMATYIEDSFVSFALLGEAEVSSLPGLKVRFTNGAEGYIGAKKKNPETAQDLFIDFGSDASKLISLGDGAAVISDTEIRDNIIYSSALNNRLCVSVLLDVARQTKSEKVSFAFTTQSNLGSRGGMGAYGALEPKEAFDISLSSSGDLPGENGVNTCGSVNTGCGMTIKLTVGAASSDEELVEKVERCCDKSVRETIGTMGGDIRYFTSANGAKPSCAIGIPARKYSDFAYSASLEDAKTLRDTLLKIIEEA